MPPRGDTSKEKRQPSITPRKFTRFFTPRSHGPSAVGSSRRVLFDVTVPANNQRGSLSSPIRPHSTNGGQENSPVSFTREMKRRKLIHTPDSSPEPAATEKIPSCDDPFTSHNEELSQGLRLPRSFSIGDSEKSTCEPSTYYNYCDDTLRCADNKVPTTGSYLLPIRASGSQGLARNLLRTRLGSMISRRHTESFPISGKQCSLSY
jgi:hypothetical protein